MKKISGFLLLIAICILNLTKPLSAQVPTVQDCYGAIPVCYGTYYMAASYAGEGNYMNEINDSTSCLLSGENNDVWYTFTTQANGILNFTIIPNIPTDDYDWSVYDITPQGCVAIYSNPSLEKSCNYAPNLGCGGVTGTNNNITGPCGGQNNQEMLIEANHTYVINVSNFSSTQGGYILDFNQSTNFLNQALITGNVFDDVNSNCNRDSAEGHFGQGIIDVNNGSFYVVTSPIGAYRFYADTGTYSLQLKPQLYDTISCTLMQPLVINIDTADLNTLLPDNNFALDTVPTQDLRIHVLNNNVVRPGFVTRYTVTYSNVGNIVMNGSLFISWNDSLQYMLCSPVADTIIANTASWSFSNLLPGEVRVATVDLLCPTSILLGDTMEFFAQVNPISGDTLPDNNSDSLMLTVVNSYDPNDKSVEPKGVGLLGLIKPTQELSYTIRFQNTGTAEAIHVYVVDTIDSSLDISTLQITGYSNYCYFTLTDSRIIKWYFNNIHLPDSNSNEPGSHGFVTYTIKPKAGLADATPVMNTAYIYFDFNPPVVTNTVLNTIDYILSVKNPQINNSYISLYPNPVKQHLNIVGSNSIKGIKVVNVLGTTITSENPSKNLADVDVSSLAKGVYVIQCTFVNGDVVTKKFLKN